MKKTALTFGLFSLVMVATSFAAPQTISSTNAHKDLAVFTDGATGGTQKKRDFHGGNVELSSSNQLNMSSVNQSVGGNKKID